MPISNFDVAPDVQPVLPSAPRFDMGNAFADAYQVADERNYNRGRQAKSDAIAEEERKRARSRQDQADAWAAETRGRDREQWNAQKQVGALAAQGDLKSAGAKAYEAGDLSGGQQLTRAHVEQLEKTLQMAQGITTIVSNAQTPEEFSYILDTAEQRGIDVKKYRQQDWQRAQRQFLVEHNYETQRMEAEAKRLGYRKLEAEVAKTEAEAKMAGVTGGEKPPTGYRMDPNTPGSLMPIPGGPADPSKPTSSVTSDAHKAMQSFRALEGELDLYKSLTNQGGVAMLPGVEKDKLLQTRRNIQLQMKELYNLGVLNGPDLALMDNMLPDATINGPLELSNGYDTVNRVTQGVDGIKKKMRDLANVRLQSAQMPQIPEPPPQPDPNGGPAAGATPRGNAAPAPRISTPDDYARLPPNTTYIAPDGSLRVKQ